MGDVHQQPDAALLPRLVRFLRTRITGAARPKVNGAIVTADIVEWDARPSLSRKDES